MRSTYNRNGVSIKSKVYFLNSNTEGIKWNFVLPTIPSILAVTMLLLSALCASAQSIHPGQHEGKTAVEVKVPLKAYSFDLRNVRLLDGPFKRNMEREQKWLMSIPVRSLLHSFRTNAGLFSGNEGGYFETKKLGGWESLDCDLRGHSTGHILSALGLMYASTRDESYKVKGDSLVKGLSDVQIALNQHGYLSAFPQTLIDRCIEGKRVWAPWYTLHKILAGLIDQYLYCDNEQALVVAEQMAGWAYKKLTPLSEKQLSVMLQNEFGGINDTFYNLYSITGKQEHLKLAEMFYHHAALDPLEKQEDQLEKKHANTFIPKVVGEARAYELTGSEKEKKITEFYWDRVVNHHSFVTGSNSDKEKFFTPDQLSKHLTGYNGETCNTYNLLKLTSHLFTWTSDVKYADYYEKALYNHILGQQDTTSGMVAYFLPMLSGAHKVYSTPYESFWCCVGTGFESHAKYGEAIYYHADNNLYVNLFIPSQLEWKEKGLVIRQETSFPEEETTRLIIETNGPTEMSIKLRYPSWAASGAFVNVNGKKIEIKQKPGSYIAITRKWRTGDRIEVTYPMNLKAIPANDDPKISALVYGPIVLAGAMGTKDMRVPAFADPKLYNEYYTYDYHVPSNLLKSLSLDVKNPGWSIKQVNGKKLTFKTKEGINLQPLYKMHQQRYVVYWELK